MDKPAANGSKPRVLFCTMGYPPDSTGGAQHQAQLQANELIARGYEVTVVCPRRGKVSSGVVDGVKVVRLPGLRTKLLRFYAYHVFLFAYLMANLRKQKLLHVHAADRQTRMACIAGRIWRRPVYIKIAAGGRGGDIDLIVRRRHGLHPILNYPRFQAISQEIVDDLESIGIETGRIERIPNGVERASFGRPSEEERAEARRRLDLPQDAVIALYVGRFHRLKGIEYLIDAWRGVKAENAQLLLVGQRTGDMMEITLPHDLPESIVIRGWSHEVDDYYAAADIFVLPSQREGMSNALLEAMASGLAVVSTTVGAAEEMIEDGERGLLVLPRDVEALRVALMRLLTNAELRMSCGEAGARYVEETFTIARVIDRIEAAYERSLAKPKR